MADQQDRGHLTIFMQYFKYLAVCETAEVGFVQLFYLNFHNGGATISLPALYDSGTAFGLTDEAADVWSAG